MTRGVPRTLVKDDFTKEELARVRAHIESRQVPLGGGCTGMTGRTAGVAGKQRPLVEVRPKKGKPFRVWAQRWVLFERYHVLLSTEQANHMCERGNEGCVTSKHLFRGSARGNQMDRYITGAGRGDNRRKLTPIQALWIKFDNSPHALITQVTGVSSQMVSYIRSGKSWAHLERSDWDALMDGQVL